VIEHFPALDSDAACVVRVLAAERTFLEKACLLHEETFRPMDKPRKLRMARHYYDLYSLLRAGIGERAMADMGLFQRVAEHREIFFRFTWVDYGTHKPGTFRLVPPDEHLAKWRADYEEMLGPMFFGETPSFDEMMAAVADFENNLGWRAFPLRVVGIRARQEEMKRRPAADCAFHADAAVVGGDEIVADLKAEAEAAFVLGAGRGEEFALRLKEPRCVLGRHAHAVVADRGEPAVLVLRRG